jgi:hypothetical protein
VPGVGTTIADGGTHTPGRPIAKGAIDGAGLGVAGEVLVSSRASLATVRGRLHDSAVTHLPAATASPGAEADLGPVGEEAVDYARMRIADLGLFAVGTDHAAILGGNEHWTSAVDGASAAAPGAETPIGE